MNMVVKLKVGKLTMSFTSGIRSCWHVCSEYIAL